MDNLLFYLHN